MPAKKKEEKKATPAVAPDKAHKIIDRYFDIILKPVVTEKSMKLTQEQNKITVKVIRPVCKFSCQ